jgi:hypothetical protein
VQVSSRCSPAVREGGVGQLREHCAPAAMEQKRGVINEMGCEPSHGSGRRLGPCRSYACEGDTITHECIMCWLHEGGVGELKEHSNPAATEGDGNRSMWEVASEGDTSTHTTLSSAAFMK